MFVYVTASDGKVTVKSEVQVIIKDSSAPNNRHIGYEFWLTTLLYILIQNYNTNENLLV